MTKYDDGVYITHPTYGPKTATRITVIEKGMVVEIDGVRGFPGAFNQSSFFDVNTFVGVAEELCPECNRHLATGYGTVLTSCRSCGCKLNKEQYK